MASRIVSGALLAAVVAVVGCGGQPAAMEVCKKLEGAGVASNCREGKKQGPAAIAKELVVFDVVGLAGRPGEVMVFGERREYVNTVKTYNHLGTYNAMRRHGNEDKLVFVAFNEKASEALDQKSKEVVDSL